MMAKKDFYSTYLTSSEDCTNLLDRCPHLVLIIELEGNIVYSNNYIEKIFGYTIDEVIGQPVWQFFSNKGQKDFKEDVKILKKGKILSEELADRRKDGSVVWLDIKLSLIEMANGKSLVLGSASDISNLIKIKHDLIKSEARVQAVLETAIEGVITIDEFGIVRSFNKAACKIFGYSEDEILGNNVNLLMPSPYKEEHDGYIQHYKETGEKRIIGIGREVRGIRKNGEIFPIELSVGEVEVDGELVFTGVVRDISERRRLENQILEIAEEERRRIGREMHDGLGQMLTGIGLISRNLAKKLKSNGLPGADEVEEISDMLQEADEMARALAHGLVNIELESEGLRPAVEQLCKRAERLFNIECNSELDRDIQLDNERAKLHLYRIAQEAINNAVKHGKASKVKVCLQREGDYIQLKIIDDGIGFKNPVTSKKLQGIGLNTMSYRANLMGGHINMVESDAGHTIMDCRIPVQELMSN